MKVVAHGLNGWYLLEDGACYFLLARCSQSPVDFELLIQLDPLEYREYHALGRVYIEYLAARVNYWSRDYRSRNLTERRATRITLLPLGMQPTTDTRHRQIPLWRETTSRRRERCALTAYR